MSYIVMLRYAMIGECRKALWKSPMKVTATADQCKRELRRLGLISEQPTTLEVPILIVHRNGFLALFRTYLLDVMTTIPLALSFQAVRTVLIKAGIIPSLALKFGLLGAMVEGMIESAGVLALYYPLDTASSVAVACTMIPRKLDATVEQPTTGAYQMYPTSIHTAIRSTRRVWWTGFPLTIATVGLTVLGQCILLRIYPPLPSYFPKTWLQRFVQSAVYTLPVVIPHAIDTLRCRYRLAAYFGFPYANLFHCAKSIVKNDGVAALWDGFLVGATRNILAALLAGV